MKRSISVFAVILCMAMLLSTAALAAGGEAAVFGGYAEISGSSIHVTVTLEEGADVRSGQLTVSFDADMATLNTFSLGESALGCDIHSVDTAQGEVELGFASVKAVPAGALLELDFTANAQGLNVFTVKVSEYSVGPEGEKGTVHTDYGTYNILADNGPATTGPSTPTTPEEPYRFEDVPEGIWYEDAVYELYERGIIEGIGNDLYDPSSDVDRASIAAIIYRLAGKPASVGGMDFEDVTGDDWYEDAVNWASEAGYMKGYGDGTFGARDTITRQDMIVTLYRYAAQNGYDVSVEGFAMPDYTDFDQVSGYARDAMVWAVKAGISNGVGGGRLAPTSTASRAEVATLIYRMIALREGK